MREQFIEKLSELASKDERVVLIVFDVGFSFIELFKNRFPKQFINLGICEPAGLNFAVGMANEGYKPVVYTMTNFILSRPNEQLRINIAYGNSNVKLFGVKGSEAYKFLGTSHNLYGTEEQDYLKNLPNINAYFPESEEQTKKFMEIEYKRVGPSYTRL